MESCPVYKIKNRAVLKKRSAKETKPIPAIYDEEVSTASAAPSTSGHFPLFKRSASRHILVFATGSNIRLLAARRTWGMDGTFKVVPQWYQQLFTIHAFVAGKLVPAVCCLCTTKVIGRYGYIFQALNKAAVLRMEMTCSGCAEQVKRVLNRLDDSGKIKNISFEMNQNKVTVQSSLSKDVLLTALQKTGKNDENTFVGKVFDKVEEKSGQSRYQAATLLAFVILHQCRSVVQLDLLLLSGNKNVRGNRRQRRD
ncbi:Copper transport protein ATX1 [Trichinella papuae]|uniref:Copper transport protein ATOX1 n=1 Tax=Trichinella papuae TaxID=268474 RepID=A0A0V1MI14_9BILA|nr:Copper transport protein ATX1 [Trichinella papuae]